VGIGWRSGFAALLPNEVPRRKGPPVGQVDARVRGPGG
jgi:hypothetical protein